MYKNIVIPYDSLVVFDIDDTILSFPQIHSTWWKTTKDRYHETHDITTADIMTYNEWLQIISSTTPILDYAFDTLLQEIKKTDSTLIFVTARNPNLATLTETQLANFNIYSDIYYSVEKGQTIKSIKKKYDHIHLVFVDDNLDNVNDVKDYNPEAFVYWVPK